MLFRSYQAKAGLDRIRRVKENLQYIIENGHESEVSEDCINQLNKRIDSFKMHMEDDLNTADAITDIFEMVIDINSQLEKNGKEYARLALSKLQEVSNILGFLQGEGTEEVPENVKILAGERQEARKNKDLVNLILSSLLALIYTNDIFTAYVFIEINTIAACAVVAVKDCGETIRAALRYLVMSLVGSGLILISICLLYDLTGHLLMQHMRTSIAEMTAAGRHTLPLIVSPH